MDMGPGIRQTWVLILVLPVTNCQAQGQFGPILWALAFIISKRETAMCAGQKEGIQ